MIRKFTEGTIAEKTNHFFFQPVSNFGKLTPGVRESYLEIDDLAR